MLARILTKLVGTKNERELNHLGEIVDRINQLEPQVFKLSDIQLRAKTAEFKQQIANGASLDDLLPEAFAVARAVSYTHLTLPTN